MDRLHNLGVLLKDLSRRYVPGFEPRATPQRRNTVLPAIYDQAASYLLSRQSANGGFCFYRTTDLDEPNLADTYYAIRALTLLGREIPRQMALMGFLSGSLQSRQASDLYYCAFGLRTLGRGGRLDSALSDYIRELPVEPAPDPNSAALTAWLQQTRMITRLKRSFTEFGEADLVRHHIGAIARKGHGFGGRPNIWDTWLALDILRCCGRVVDFLDISIDIVGFLDRIQVSSFGFSMVEDATAANLDTILSGVRCCELLGLPVKYSTAALSFVLACQSANGGFSRAPDALPDIELTHKAVWIMTRLTGISK